ncbi:MAG: TonB-dependent receptor [Gammaproteobacteria bacterium]
MNQTLRLKVLAALGLLTPLMWHEALALDAAQLSDSSESTLTTIIVTAEKRAEPLKDVPMSVSAISGGTLDDLQARQFTDYAALVPGLSVASSQPGLTRLTLRGQNAGGVGSTVGVYVDETPFGSSTALLNGSVNTGDFDTWDMQRIEVLRGPQGTLYGANTEGGLLKFVTNAPVLGSFSGAAEVAGESVDHGGNGGAVHATLNLPLGDKVAFRISGFGQDAPGYVDDPSRGVKDVNEGHKSGGRASLLAVPSDNLSIRLTASTQQSKYDGTNVVDVDPATLRPLHGDLTQERLFSEPSNFKYSNYNATVDWNAGPVRLLSSTSYGILKTDTDNDLSPLYGGLAGALFGGTPGALLDDNVGLKKFTQEIRLTSAASDFLEWQVGGYYTRETGEINEHLNGVALVGGATLGLIEQPVIDSTYKESAGFGDVTFHFNKQFDIQVGGRYSHNQQTATQTTIFNPLFAIPTQIVNGESSGNIVTYSVAPRWHVDANTMVYARVASGYRPGGPNVIPPSAPPTVEGQYGADKTTSVELGVKSTLLDGILSLDLSAFHVDWKNIQLFEVVDGFGINGNGGTARSQGLEWTLGYLPVHGLTFQWTGAYTDAKLTSDAPALDAASGDRLPYAPKWGTSVDGEYDWNLFADFKGFVGATWSYVGSRASDFSSSVATPPGQLDLPSYNTTAIRLGVDNGKYRVSLYGKNLSDSRGITNFLGSGSPYPQVTVIQPRTVGVALSAKF